MGDAARARVEAHFDARDTTAALVSLAFDAYRRYRSAAAAH
jgi:hypothetical protein